MASRLFSSSRRLVKYPDTMNASLWARFPHAYTTTSCSAYSRRNSFKHQMLSARSSLQNVVTGKKRAKSSRSVVSVAFVDGNGTDEVSLEELTDDRVSSRYEMLKGARDARLRRGRRDDDHVVETVHLPSELRLADLYKYNSNEVVGSGTYGTVFKAQCKETGQTVAIKEMKKYAQLHYQREIDMLKRVNYKGCVRLLRVLETGDKAFLVMELLRGGDLFDFIVDTNVYLGNMTIKEALVLTRAMLCSLEACHLKNFAHLDVKPENFVFRDDSKGADALVLVDFGAAQPFRLRPFAREKEQYVGGMDDYWIGLPESHIGGTASYVSPEVVIDGRFSSRSDMWSMGVTLYMMLTGQRPFEADHSSYHRLSGVDREIQGKIKLEAERARNESIFKTCKDLEVVHPGTKRLLEEMTQPDPAHRPSTTEAIHYIDKVLTSL